MKKIFEKLSEHVITQEDLVFILEQIEIAKKLSFQAITVPLSEKLKNKIDERLRKEIEKLEREEKFLSVGQESEFLDNFKNFLLKLPKMKLEIAFEPREVFILELDKWFKENLGKKIILDIFVNPKIVGGAKIEYQGKWKDYSLAKEIEKIYE
jgi:F0F1-type ATP synthase delta subunit